MLKELKIKLKKTMKSIIGENLKIHNVKFEPDNCSRALKDYIIANPDSISSYKKIGRRKDNKEFYPAVKKIEQGYDLLYRDLHKYDKNGVGEIIEYSSVRSGTPMRTKPFPMCKEYIIRMLFSKYLYRYPAITDVSLGAENVVDYLVKEGYQLQKSSGYDGLGVENIVFTYSTTHAFNMILNTICRPEDIVIMTGPNYGLFAVEPEKINARVEILDLFKEDNWFVNPKKLEKRIDELNSQLAMEFKDKLNYKPKVVAFLNMNPHNPLGKVMNSKNIDILKGIGDVCLDKGVFVIDDLIYRDLTYDQNDLAVPLATMPKYFNNTISLFGVSKAYGLAGIRAGVIVAPVPIRNGLCDVIFSTMDSISMLQTQAIAGAFNASNRRYRCAKKYFKKVINGYKYRLNLLEVLIDGIDIIKDNKIKSQIIKDIKKYSNNDSEKTKKLLNGIEDVVLRKDTYPESGFFAIVDFSKLKGKKHKNLVILDDASFVEYLYSVTKIKCIMGLNMSWPNENEIIARISFSLDINDLIYNFDLIGDAVRNLR